MKSLEQFAGTDKSKILTFIYLGFLKFGIVLVFNCFLSISAYATTPKSSVLKEDQCPVLEITANTEMHSKQISNSGLGWVYSYAGEKSFWVLVPNHVIDLGVDLSQVKISANCNENKYPMEVVGKSNLLDLTVLKFRDNFKNPHKIIVPLIVLEKSKENPKLLDFYGNWQTQVPAFAVSSVNGKITVNSLMPADQIVYNHYLFKYKDLKPSHLDEFPQYPEVLVYPFAGVQPGLSGAPIFLGSDFAPTGMILATLPFETASLILPFEVMLTYLKYLETGVDPELLREPKINLKNQLILTGSDSLNLQRVLTYDQDTEKIKYIETCSSQNTKYRDSWAPTGGSWVDIGGGLIERANNKSKVPEPDDRITANKEKVGLEKNFYPKFDLSRNNCNSDGLLEVSSSGAKKIIGIRDSVHPEKIWKVNSIERLFYLLRKFQRLGRSFSIKNYTLYEHENTTTYDLICQKHLLGPHLSLSVERESHQPEIIMPNGNEKHFMQFKGNYFLSADKFADVGSNMQIRCLPESHSILIYSLQKQDKPLLIFIIKNQKVFGLFNFNLSELNSEEKWTFDSSNPLELIAKFLDFKDYKYGFEFSKDNYWNIESAENQNYQFNIIFDSTPQLNSPIMTIEFSKIPEDQQYGVNFGFDSEGRLPLKHYMSKWYRGYP